MRNLSLLLVFAASFTACNNNSAPAVDAAKEQQALLDADAGFCAMEMKDGMGKAMEKYYDADVVTIGPNQPVSQGKASVLKTISDAKMDTMSTLNWKAEKAVVSASGDLGYVWGRYHCDGKTKAGNDTTLYGAYATIYKKTAEGWKVVLDLNDDTPKP